MADRVRVIGLPRLQSTLGRAADGMDPPQAAQREAAQIVAQRARSRSPRRTGRLASSVTGRVQGSAVTVGTPVSYGLPVHQGVPSRGQRGQPFLADALHDTESAWLEAYRRDVQAQLDNVRGA